jgi:sialate O-acetylesterase
MVLRICPYGIRGVLYYQGEEDANRTQGYDRLLTQLILQYRRDWQEEIPFVIMQLPMFVGQNDPENYSWARLRLAQKRVTRSLPNTMLTVLLDLGELDNIHPVDKRTPGERLAAQVLEQVYQKPVPGSAMELSRVERQGTEINLYFDSTYGRIKQADNDLQDFRHAKRGDMPVGFEWSEDGTHWYPANARIDGERIILWSENGTQPWGIRYGHFNYGKVNVYNRAGLPLEPFCVKLDGLAGTQWSMSLLENQDTGAPQKD